jgi:hypothetical protein
MPRLRPRISLLSALLLMTIVGLSIVTIQLWREIEPLRAQVRSMRTELGLLNIDDPSVAHAIQLGTREADHWKWRIYLPEIGSYDYELVVYDGTIPPRMPGKNWYNMVRKNASGMSTAMGGGEFVFSVELEKQGDRWLVRTSRGVDRRGGVSSVNGDWLSNREGGHGITSSAGYDAATTYSPGQPIHLMTLLEQVETKNGTMTTWSTPTGPANGIVIWIEQLLPATNNAAPIP